MPACFSCQADELSQMELSQEYDFDFDNRPANYADDYKDRAMEDTHYLEYMGDVE
jgi:hypothetical protein